MKCGARKNAARCLEAAEQRAASSGAGAAGASAPVTEGGTGVGVDHWQIHSPDSL